MSENRFTLPAFAKVNLGLRILGRRPDGYHELDTIFQTVSLNDTIRLAPIDNHQIVLTCDDRSLPIGDDNLVYRAAKALQQRFAPKQGAHLRLTKRIPAQSGLGGGSSDAALTVLGLSHLWKLSVTRQDFFEIASRLGADVPFFLHGGTARGNGIGNEITPLSDYPDKFLLIIKPNCNISTSDAYKALDERSLTTPNSKTILSSSQRREVFDNASLAALENDFEAIAFELEPEISRAKAALMSAGAQAAMLAGSGSAVFGIFDSEDAQRRAIQAIELEAGWRVFPCKMVGRADYEAALGELRQFLA